MNKEQYLAEVDSAASWIEKECGKAGVAIVLGSGLGDYAEELTYKVSLPYADIPHFPQSTVKGHAGVWHAGTLAGKRVYMMQGRFHGYEGYEPWTVVFPIRVMQRLGVKTLVLTNAAGGVNTGLQPGCLMAITDYINMTGKNPLIGPNLDEFGPRFPDMSRVFSPELLALCREAAQEAQVPLCEGVYAQMNGPSYESPAEIRMLRTLGADAVGMSTVPEAIVAAHGGLRVLGVSCITNMAAGILDQPLEHQEVVETGKRAQSDFRALVNGFVARL